MDLIINIFITFFSINSIRTNFEVENIFNNFLLKLEPDQKIVESNYIYANMIINSLKKKFISPSLLETGSYNNKTWIKEFSDFDFFVVLNYDNYLENSSSFLGELKDIIDDDKNEANIFCPSVRINCNKYTSESVEITPSFFHEAKNNHKIYLIPDCNSKWQKSSPNSHEIYLNNIDMKLNYKVKPLIRLLKAWKYYNEIPIKSLYIELIAAKYAYSRHFINYEDDIINIIGYLSTTSLKKIDDPVGITNPIFACVSFEKQQEILTILRQALIDAKRATKASKAGRVEEALRLWNVFFCNNLI